VIEPIQETPPPAEPDKAELCVECEQVEAAYEGLCYQCQCYLHSIGAYDMDGTGWK
jgi:uncharacterized paraquat-inducible protein A